MFVKSFTMSKPLYEFAHNEHVVKGPHAPDLPVTIQSTNVVFSDEIPKQIIKLGIEDFINYVKSFLLQYAFWCVESHGIIIPIPSLSSKIINVAPIQVNLPITMRMQKWIEKPYVVESYEFEDDDKNDKEDGNEEDGNKEGADEEEDTDDAAQHELTPPFVETTEPMIQDVKSPMITSLARQAKTLPIMIVAFHQDNQEESNINFQTTVFS
ncbi:unnamed protein product [Lactuca saligna]|uniref:Uncharacterized protein n=1 Tax=Lactuca saligna TaxID=75948 RepID=A0AA36E4V2_LACSI|nr:unnamed protein product [Lactuca saligna]